MTVTYSREELLADPPFAQRLHHDGRLLHGGLDDKGQYLPPRSAHRLAAIAAWLFAAGAAQAAVVVSQPPSQSAGSAQPTATSARV